MKYEFQGQVRNGNLHIVNRKGFDEAVSEIGADLVITLEKKKSKRSLSQNAYYWSGVIPIIRERLIELGHRVNKEQTHEFLANKFLKQELADGDGMSIGHVTRSTTSLNKSEFADYIEEIAQFAAEVLNVVVPPPMTQTTIAYQ